MDTTLTGADVIALYKKWGLRPEAGHAGVWSGTCCVLGVLYTEKTGVVHPAPEMSDLRTTLGITINEASQIVTGFDYGSQNTPLEAWAAGIRRAVFGHFING